MMKFKGTKEEMRIFLNKKTGLITDANGETKFEFVEGEGIKGVVEEHEDDYRKVLAEVNFETGNVEFKDAGNYMEVPIEVIQVLSRQLETRNECVSCGGVNPGDDAECSNCRIQI